MIVYMEFIIIVTLLAVMGLADAVLVKNNSAVLYPALIFGLHLPLVLLFVLAVFIVNYFKKNRNTAADDVNPQNIPVVNNHPQNTQVQDIPIGPKFVPVGYLKVPRYWSDTERYKETEIHLIDITNNCKPIKKLVYGLWKPDEVGKGRDAKPTKYKYIHIHNVKRVQNVPLYNKYTEKKKMMTKKENYIDYFKDLSEVANLPVQTTDLIQRTPYLNKSILEIDVDHHINEHYLFHGTGSIEAAESICREGLSTAYSGTGLFGKGLYTAENPTKSDQYTGTYVQGNLLKETPPGIDMMEAKK